MLGFFIKTLSHLLLFYIIVISIAYALLISNGTLQSKYKHLVREFKYSVLSLLLFSVIATILYETKLLNYTTLYYNISEHGWFYYFGIIPIIFLIYDFYFYLTHILMHHKKLFNFFHLTHHKSKEISPMSALSMDPLEAIINHGALLLLFLLFPIHTSHVYLWVAVTITYTTYLHLGTEIFSNKFLQTKLGKLINTTTTHSQHHLKFKGNYGFYTLIWDKLFKTERNA